MSHRNTLLAALAATVLVSSPVFADTGVDVDVDVDVAAPFDEDDLTEAIRLRHAEGDVDGAVRVARLGPDRFVVSVGDRAQIVELTTDDRAISARVVALVVVALIPVDRTTRVLPVEDEVPPLSKAPALEAPAPKRRAYRMSVSFTRDDNGYEIPIVNAGGAYALSPHANVVATAGIGRYADYLDTNSLIMPVRVGIEGRAGAAGIEIGTQRLFYREDSCGAAEWGAAQSVHGVGRVFLPIAGNKRLTAEIGGHMVVANDTTSCRSASNFTEYGGWVGFGVEWQ
jgi:hypothetical protein